MSRTCTAHRRSLHRSQISKDLRWRFLRRKGPDCPATILFCYSDCETIGIPEDEYDDEYPRKPRLFWVRHGNYRGLAYSRQNSKSCNLLTASEMLSVSMGSTRRSAQLPI